MKTAVERFLFDSDVLDKFAAPIDKHGLLFPPESLLASERYRELLVGGDVIPCLPGGIILAEGGSGKTTFLQQIAESLGEHAKMFLLGNYANDSSGLRMEVEAFLDSRSGTGDSYLLFDALDENSEIIGPLTRLVEKHALRADIHIWVASRNISQIARLSAIEKTRRCYFLAPLSHENIRALAEEAGVDAMAFYIEAEKLGMLCVSAKPMGCTALIEAFKANSGSLAGMDVRNLWRSMVEKLLDQKADKVAPSRFALTELLQASEWIALTLSLTGKQGIWTTGRQSECPQACVSLGSLVYIEKNLSQDLLLETLRRGLFAPEKGGKTRFSHESYKDFLAAMAFTEFSLHPHWKTFFLSEDRKIVFPSRREIFGWYALENEEARRHLLDTAPEILLLSRELVSVVGAKTLCEAVFKCVSAHKYGWDKQRDLKLHNLQSAETLSFVTNKLRNSDISDDAFDFLADVVKACEFNDAAMVSFFAGIVADRSRRLRQRHDASYVLQKAHLSGQDFVKLKSLLPLTEADEDPFSTIRGAILRVCWPEHLSEAEIEGLSSRPFTNSYGSYEAFFDALPDLLVARDKPKLALPWLRWANERLTHEAFQDNSVAKQIFTVCWRWASDNESVLHELTKGWSHAAMRYDTPFAWDEHAATNSCLSERWFKQNAGHRRAIAEIVIERGSQEACKHLIMFWGRCPLLFENDFIWIQDKLSENANNASAMNWWTLVEAGLNGGWQADVTELNQFHRLRPDLMPDTVETLLAGRENRRKNFAQTERRWETAEKRRQRRKRDADGKLFHSIQEFLTRGAAPIPTINFLRLSDRLMHLDDGDWSSRRVYDAPAWSKLSGVEKHTMVALAKRFLLESENPNPEGSQYIGFAIAVVRAMALLRHQDPLAFENLPESAWKRNGAELLRIAGFGNSAPDRNISTVLLNALAKHESAATEALQKNIFWDFQQDPPSFSALHKWGARLTAKQEAAVMEIVRSESASPERQCALLEALHGIGRDREAKAFLSEVFPNGNLMNRPETVYHRFRGLAFALSPKGYIESLLQILREESWAKAFIETAWNCGNKGAYGAALGTFVLENCLPEQFADFFAWIYEAYPSKDEPRHDRSFSPTVIDNIYLWRSCILGVMKKPDCQNGVEMLEAICRRLPDEGWIHRHLSEAREAYHSTRLPTLSPLELSNLVREREARFINNGADLLELVMEAIRKYEVYLQEGTNGCPAIMNLWNKQEGGSLLPRDEETLSDDLKRYLDLVLAKGVIINREVQIKRKLHNDGIPGSRTDLWIQAKSTEGLIATLCIETKCSWNDSATRALENQLVKKYMGDGRASHGILLLGWYDCLGYNRNQAWSTRDEAAADLARQASCHSNVQTIVIDCSVH